jgi:hypothetical protein
MAVREQGNVSVHRADFAENAIDPRGNLIRCLASWAAFSNTD